MTLQSPQEVCGMTPEARALEVYADLAVLHAMDDVAGVRSAFEDAVPDISEYLCDLGSSRLADLYEYVHALRCGDPKWRLLLAERVAAVPRAQMRMWLADNTLVSAYVEDEALLGGVAMRRLDAVLDIAAAPFCALDIQSLVASVAEDLASAKVTATMRASTGAAAAAVGFAGGFFGQAWAGAVADRGRGHVLDRIAHVDDQALAGARLVVAALAATNMGEEPPPEVAALWQYLFGESARLEREWGTRRQEGLDASDVARDARIVAAATLYVTEAMPTAQRSRVCGACSAPDTTGMSLAAAKRLLQAIDVGTDEWDAMGQSRSAMRQDNWYVAQHVVLPRQRRARLSIRKFGEG